MNSKSALPSEPIVVSESIELRVPSPSDAEAISHHGNNIKIAKYLTSGFPYPYTVESAHNWIKNVQKNLDAGEQHGAMRGIFVDGNCVGSLGVHMSTDPFSRCADLWYWLGEAFWGQGIMTKVVARFVDVVFECYPQINNLMIHFKEGNIGSSKVAKKLGFKLETTRRGYWAPREGDPEPFDGYADSFETGLLRSEWEAQKLREVESDNKGCGIC